MGPCSLCCKLWKTYTYFHFQENPQMWEDWSEAKSRQRQVYFCSCDRGLVCCISARHRLPFLYIYWGSHNCTEVKVFHEAAHRPGLSSHPQLGSMKQKPSLCLTVAWKYNLGHPSPGVNAPTCPACGCRAGWDTAHRAAGGSPSEKGVPQPSHTSSCPPCSTQAGPPTKQPKEKIQENSSPPRKSAVQDSSSFQLTSRRAQTEHSPVSGAVGAQGKILT